MNKPSKLLALILFAVLAPGLAKANAIFTLGNNPQPNEENVLLSSGATGSTVQGSTNQSNTLVNFVSATQILNEPSSGQARIEATSGGNQVALGDVSFSLANAGTFAAAVFNMFIGGTIGTAGGTATISALTNDGLFTFQTTLGNGQNFLTVTTTGGEVISSIGISSPIAFTDLRQIRIAGITGVGGVPDSGATLPLLGATVLGLAFLRRKLTCA